MDRLAEIIDELCELRRFKYDLLIGLCYGDGNRKVVSYSDEDLNMIFGKIGDIIRENNGLRKEGRECDKVFTADSDRLRG